MATETLERPRTGGPGSGVGGNWLVIVMNDDHNTFDHVAESLAYTIPGVTLANGYALADRIHRTGLAIVWTGERDLAQQYWEQLADAGLTIADETAATWIEPQSGARQGFLSMMGKTAEAAGVITEAEAEAFHRGLEEAADRNAFHMSLTMYAVAAAKG